MSLKGQNLGNQSAKGYRHTEEAKIKIGLASKDNQYAKGNKANKTSFKKGHKTIFTEEIKNKLSKTLKGRRNYWFEKEKNPNWKGGITKLTKQIRECFKYRQWRSDVFTKDDFTCQECEIKGREINAHHIKLFAEILEEYQIKSFEEALNCEELWNINNGRTLCKNCHICKF